MSRSQTSVGLEGSGIEDSKNKKPAYSGKFLPLSVAIIAHNAERNIGRCLNSVRDIAAEIIVVHNDCSDNTVKIASELGAKTVEQEWLGFRDQKNVALDHASQPWILSLDSDEEVSPKLLKSIRGFIQSDDPHFAGGYFARKVWFMGRWITHGDWYPDHCLRILRNNQGKWDGGIIHEKLEIDGAVKKLDGDLLHYPSPDMNDQLSKMVKYSDLFLEHQLENNKRWSAVGTVFRSCWRFFRSYILRLGFLDGFPGLYVSWVHSFSVFYRYSRLYEHLNHKEFPEDKEV
jgi:glycosyltransferase involved in cell wall biosynthesis